MSEIAFGQFTLKDLERSEPRSGETVTKRDADGIARLFEVRGPGGLHLVLADTTWDTGEREVRAESRLDSPERFDQLVDRLRLTVLPSEGGQSVIDLKQARLKTQRRAGLFKASESDLADGAGVDVVAALTKAGATAVGTRETVLGDGGPRRGFMCATFDEEGDLVPVVAFVLTRVAPVAKGVHAGAR